MAENIENNGGEIRISNDVISVIAGMALCEVQGVFIEGKLPDAFIDRSNAKNINKSIKIDVSEAGVSIAIVISVEYGKNIAQICADVQEKIKAAVQTMTGLNVCKIDVAVSDLIFKKDTKGEIRK